MNTFENSNNSDEAEGYHLDVTEVAQLLGVTRTRVSQLTSNGQLSFERRRVGTRNRLFYKRSEVIRYQRDFFGKHTAKSIHLDADLTRDISDDLPRTGASARFATPADLIEQGHLNSNAFRNSIDSNIETRALLRAILNHVTSPVFTVARNGSLKTSAIEKQNEEEKSHHIQVLTSAVDSLSAQIKIQQQSINCLADELIAAKTQLRKIIHDQFIIRLDDQKQRSRIPNAAELKSPETKQADSAVSAATKENHQSKKLRFKTRSPRPSRRSFILKK